MIDSIIDRLKKLNLDLTPEEIADILWLGIQMQRSAPTPDAEEPSEQSREIKQSEIIGSQNISNQVTRSSVGQAAATAYLSTTSNTGTGNTPTPSRTVVFKTPEAPALRNPLLLARAMKPLMQKYPSRTRTVLDEEATVNRIADESVWQPVEKPAPERWFDLVLVVEESPSVAIWRKAIEEWRQLVKHHGAFRDVRTWYLREGNRTDWELYPTSRAMPARSRPRHPKELLETSGRQLILFVSDCVSSLWQQGKIYPLLETWTKQSSVSILQLMPERYWERSVLGRGRFVQFGTFLPEPLNTQLWVEALPIWETPLKLKTALKLPVITFDPDSLGQWAKVMTGNGNTTTAGVVFESSQTMTTPRRQSATAQLSGAERVKRFRATASLPARQLAGLMAAAPVSLPVARLIQQTMLPNSNQAHLAEVFLSGLIKVADEADLSLDPEHIRYQFFPDVRESLLQAVPVSDADEVLDRVSDYIARRAGLSIRSFDALLEMYPTLDEEKRRLIEPFAQVTPQVLRRLGGTYAEIADELEVATSGGGTVVQEETGIPVTLEILEFDVATISIGDAIEEEANQELPNVEETVELEAFEFETIKVDGSGREIERIRGTAHQFVESFSEDATNKEPNQRYEPTGQAPASIPPQRAGNVPKEIQIFFSYSHRDEALCDELAKHLKLLQRQGVIASWNDRKISAGTDWAREINNNLNAAEIILFLISADFLATDYSYGTEMRRAIERHEAGEARVIPVILRPCDWAGAPFGKLQALPRNANPVTRWSNRDKAFLDVVQGIRRAAKEILSQRAKLEMVAIPGGTFLMGSPEDEPERLDGEGPQHTVSVHSFFLSKYPVTQAQWRAVVAMPQVNRELDPDPSRFKGDNRPVEKISWYEAIEFCDRLCVYTGKQYRLPSEAEWEYACRAGAATAFHFGETITTDLANYDGNHTYGAGPKGIYREETTAVGSFGVANSFGLYDMHGNVFEWCQDHWHNHYEEAPTDGSAWLSEDENALRVIRGGSWFINSRDCRSAYRNSYAPAYHNDYIGFRVVCSAPRTLVS